MKVVQINPVCSASTGKIAVEISKLLNSEGIENYIYYTSGYSDYENAYKYANDTLIKVNALLAKIFGNYGFNSRFITKRLISELKKIKPDVIHLHNLHSHNVNLEMLFSYLKSIDVKIIWTFHDCWSFTGYCTHFDYIGCNKWKKECKNCPERKSYSWFFDRSTYLYKKKKELFTGVEGMTIVTPSKWLAELVKESIFGKYPVKVIYNGIDTDIFKPTASDFRKTYGLENKKILLGIAMNLGERKGFNYFLELSKIIPDDMRIVLVGVNKKQTESLPENIIGIEKTANQKELAEIYTAADVFVNPTREEVFGLVNVEALACGTPVVTFDTGGSPECIDDIVGAKVEKGDIKAMLFEANKFINKVDIDLKCRERVIKNFDSKNSFKQYLDLYKVNR